MFHSSPRSRGVLPGKRQTTRPLWIGILDRTNGRGLDHFLQCNKTRSTGRTWVGAEGNSGHALSEWRADRESDARRGDQMRG